MPKQVATVDVGSVLAAQHRRNTVLQRCHLTSGKACFGRRCLKQLRFGAKPDSSNSPKRPAAGKSRNLHCTHISPCLSHTWRHTP